MKIKNVRDRKEKEKEKEKKREKSNNMKLFKLCKKMVVITCSTCITTIINTLLTGWLINVAVTTSIDVAINGICIMLSFAFLDKWFDIMCCCCNHCDKCKQLSI